MYVIDNKMCMEKEKKIPRDPVCDGKIVMIPSCSRCNVVPCS
jgi:hypothetical protein